MIGVDVNSHAVDKINQDKIHIVEPDLDKTVKIEPERNGYLKSFTTPQKVDAF